MLYHICICSWLILYVGSPHVVNTSYGRDLIKHVTSYKLSRRKMLIAVVAWAGYGFCISGMGMRHMR